MSSFLTDPGAPGPKADARPPIWADGKQRAKIDPRSFLRVSLSTTRAWLAPRLHAASGRAVRLSFRVAQGEFAPLAARLGRVERVVPGRAVVAGALHGSAHMLLLAAETAAGPAPLEPLPFRGWNNVVIAAPEPAPPAPVPAPAPTPAVETAPPDQRTKTRRPSDRPRRPPPLPMPPREQPGADRDTLEAIRSVIHLSEVAPVRRTARHIRNLPPPPPELRGAEALPDLAPDGPPEPGIAMRLAGQALGFVFIGVAFPVGLAHATLASLRGEDLRLRD